MLVDRFSSDVLPRAARTLELFLDELAAYSIDSESCLRLPEYVEGLTDTELETRRVLLELESISGRTYSPLPEP